VAIQLPWVNTVPITVALSPLLSPWIWVGSETTWAKLIATFFFAGGTSVHSIEGSLDGVNVDADYTYAAPTSAASFLIVTPFVRWKTVQTVADATKSKVFLRGVNT